MELIGTPDRNGKCFDIETKNLIVKYDNQGLTLTEIISKVNTKHEIKVSREGVRRFINRYKISGSLQRKPKAVSFRKLTTQHREFIDLWLSRDNSLSADDICSLLQERFDIIISRQHVCHVRRELGWISSSTKYCQLISNVNKEKRMEWCCTRLSQRERFKNVIFVDETTIEMCSQGNIFLYKKDSELECLPPKVPKPKHSYKVHFWGGISYRGRTDCCIFSGIMDSVIYQKILQDNFIPFVERSFPDGYRLYQDNDSKHCSKSTKAWMAQNNMLQNIMPTPASSPDLNPVENVWSEMKNYLKTKVKPRKKEELISGIRKFWEGLTVEQCARYIDHIHRVIPQVLLNHGGPTNF